MDPARFGRATAKMNDYVSRPASGYSSLPPSRPSSAVRNDAKAKAGKLSRIGLLLHKQGEPDALRHLQSSLHLDPSAGAVWKATGHALAQSDQPSKAVAAFRTAAALAQSSGGDAAAHAGLATVLTPVSYTHLTLPTKA